MQRRSTRLLKLWLFLLMAALWEPAGASAQEAGEGRAAATPAVADREDAEAANEPDGAEEAAAEEKLPRLEDMELPSAEQLLRGPRVDWIVLKRNQEVLVAEPVSPRPETLAKMQEAIDEKNRRRSGISGDALLRFREELEAMSKLRLRLPDQPDEADYLLPMRLVEQILHHEDLVLRRVDVLTREGNFDLAYELLNILRRNTPDWPGALDRHNALLLAETERKVGRGELESALATLEEIHSRSPQYAGLSERVGQVVDRLIEGAVDAEDWRRARYYRGRLERLSPDHPSVAEWRFRFLDAAERELAEAERARSRGEHRVTVLHAERAARIWPRTPNLRARYRSIAERYQRLIVGVLDLPSAAEQGGLKSPADVRAKRLNQIRFFDLDHADDGAAHYSTRFCDRWEPLNLGREVLFELRDRRQPWEAQPVVTAPVIAEQIAARLDPASHAYDERLASYVKSIHVESPFSFRLSFHRVPARTESLLTIPVVEAEAGGDISGSTDATIPVSTSGYRTVTGGFQLVEWSPDSAVYRRALPEPDDVRQYHLAEIEERRYADADAALQGLIRGEVSMLVRPPAWIVDLIRRDEELLKGLFVEEAALPVTHVVQFHPRSQPLKVREYRRALAYALDRRRILTETVLRGRAAGLGRVIDGPFPSRSAANNALVRTREYDPVAAFSLALAARKQLGGELPPLRMAVIGDQVVREAADELVASWARFGIEVRILELSAGAVPADGEAPQWDLLYRTVQLAEPVSDLWPFLTVRETAQLADLDPFPDWLRQELIGLDLASDWRTALRTVNRLHLQLWGDVMLLPLWEVDDYLIYRKNVRGVPVSPVHPYADIDRWIVEPWYPEDEP